MGIFSRLGEIINANISTMLEKAENPEKMIRLMIHEMEDTLTEVKSSAAEVIAERIRIERRLKTVRKNRDEWEQRAELALSKDRDDLAREALERKLLYENQTGQVELRLAEAEETVRQYQEDIARLEEKLKSAHTRQQELIAGMKLARQRKQVEDRLHQANNVGAFERFEAYTTRLDRMEAELEVSKTGNKDSLEDRFRELERSGDVETELASLKKKKSIKPKP